MLTILDGTNINYSWGSQDARIGLDCFGLAVWLRARWKPGQSLKSFAWVYNTYSRPEHPRTLVSDMLALDCEPRVGPPQHLDLVSLQVRGGVVGLGTVLEEAGNLYIAWMSKTSQVQPISRFTTTLQGIWVPDNLVVPYAENPLSLERR